MAQLKSHRPARGFDLMLITAAVVMGLIFLPMIVELSGDLQGRLVLLGGMVLLPMMGLAFVHYRDGSPPSAPQPIKRSPRQ